MAEKSSLSSLWQDGLDVMIHIHVRAGAKRNALVKEHNQALRVDIKAAPERGAANDAVVRFFATLFTKPVADIEIKHGHTSRDKLLIVHNCRSSDIVPIIARAIGDVDFQKKSERLLDRTTPKPTKPICPDIWVKRAE